MAYKAIDDLEFTPDEEGELERLCFGSFQVRLMPHYTFACGYYNGDDSRKDDYIEWQKSRGKDWKLKTNKYEHLLQSIRRKGLKKPITVKGNRIVSGHHRAAACAALGRKEIECILL